MVFSHPFAPRPIIFFFDAEEFYFEGTFVLATIANRDGDRDPSFNTTQSSIKYVEPCSRSELRLRLVSSASCSNTSTMDEDDLVSYRQYTATMTGHHRAGKKRPAPSVSPPPPPPPAVPQHTTTNAFDQESDVEDGLSMIETSQQQVRHLSKWRTHRTRVIHMSCRIISTTPRPDLVKRPISY